MGDLEKIKEILDEVKYSVNGLCNYVDLFPPFLFTTDIYSFLDDIKYIRGYVDCMIAFKIPLEQSQTV